MSPEIRKPSEKSFQEHLAELNAEFRLKTASLDSQITFTGCVKSAQDLTYVSPAPLNA